MTQIILNDEEKIKLTDNLSYKYYDLTRLSKDQREELEIAIIFSNYNLSINESLLNGYLNQLSERSYNGNVGSIKAPGGAFEIPFFCKKVYTTYQPRLVLALGCIIKGDTKHYDFLSSTITNAISNLSLNLDIPIINGVLTVENNQQAIDRACTNMNKGKEFADTTLDVLQTINSIRESLKDK